MDYESYLHKMDLGLPDKSFFVHEVDLDQFDYIVDFGCADGSLILSLCENWPQVKFVGYDIDPQMLAMAQEKCAGKLNTEFTSELADITARFGKKAVVFSSVLHEVALTGICVAEIVDLCRRL